MCRKIPLLVVGCCFVALSCNLVDPPESSTPPFLVVQDSVIGSADTVHFRVVNATASEVSFNACLSANAQMRVDERWVDAAVGPVSQECSAQASSLIGVGAQSAARFILNGSAIPGWYRLTLRARIDGKTLVTAVSNPFRIE